MQYNKMLKEIAVLKAQAETRHGSCIAFLNELLPCDTGLDEIAYELVICFSKKPTKIIHFKNAENAVNYLNEYLEQNKPQKDFVFFDSTGLED